MMTLLGKLQNVSIQFGSKTILKDVTMDIRQGGCIGIVGANGEGKSTLLSVLANEKEPSEGFIQWFGGIPSMHYFKQQVSEPQEFSPAQKRELHKWQVPKGRSYELMSGGEQMKQRLVQAFSNQVQILILDEPTNHLDQQSLHELIAQVKRFKGTVMVVSHDRHFLDEVADGIWEVEHQGVKAYEGNYSVYCTLKDERRKAQTHLFEVQQKKIAQIDEQISSLQNWSAKAHSQSTKQEGYKEHYRVKAKRMDTQIRSKRKRLEGEKAKAELNRPTEEKAVSFSIEANRKQGNRVIESKSVTKTFGSHTLWKDASFTIKQGERVALVGPNGCGKSTWLKMLMEEEPYEGELWRTKAMRIGYLQQSIDDLPEEKTPEEWFVPHDFDSRGMIQTLMINLGFGEEHWRLPIKSMSMGEKLKLKLMAFMLEQKDVLLLDEPTNHLDLPSREQLEQTLSTYPGTIIVVTHDRYFLEKIATKLLVFEDRCMKKIDMTFKEWQNRQVETAQQQQLLKLETERQAILGEISFISKHDSKYEALDQRFNELTAQINALK
ncbi:ABC-F family ATP-binding cassette domain-containing protein [Paenisporosarcina sp. FSL H8-0542]|uniref:ribosomal protection-like ABC-F family protein n=1 Tax=Paenisporosarcina sp. FSL H8-0542 TaxID=2921401 RepID=UPI00315A8209